MKIVNTPTDAETQPYFTNIIINYLVIGLYKITTGSIKLVLDIKPLGGSSKYIGMNWKRKKHDR